MKSFLLFFAILIFFSHPSTAFCVCVLITNNFWSDLKKSIAINYHENCFFSCDFWRQHNTQQTAVAVKGRRGKKVCKWFIAMTIEADVEGGSQSNLQFLV